MTDLLARLAGMTPARVRLDSAGTPLPLSRLLAFQEDHASARDAIFAPVDWAGIEAAIGPLHHLRSRARNRQEYLRRPDLGRQMHPEAGIEPSAPTLAIILADGLSPPALVSQAPALVRELRQASPEAREAPIFAATEARVALGDAVGHAAQAEMVLVLIGERPGLTVANSLGAYLTYAPRPGTRDSARNCVSNIHDKGGLSALNAAARLAWLIKTARATRQTGVGLKDTSPGIGPEITGP